MRRRSIDSRPVVWRRERAARRLLAALVVGAGFLPGASAAKAGEGIPDPGPGDGGTVILGEDHAWRFFRGTQDPPADWNSPGFDDSSWEQGPTGIGYGDGDEFTWRDFPTVRMFPAAQCLDTNDGLAALVHDRLIQNLQLIGFDRLAQVRLEQLARGQIRVHRRVVDAGAAAAFERSLGERWKDPSILAADEEGLSAMGNADVPPGVREGACGRRATSTGSAES